MADDFQAGVCGGSWWNPPPSTFISSLSCSSTINALGSFGWPTDLVEMKARYSDESAGSASEGSIIFPDIQNPINPDSLSSGSNFSMDSTFQTMSGTEWNQDLLDGSKRRERSTYQTIMQDDLNSSLSFHQKNSVDCFSLDNQPLVSITSSGEATAATCKVQANGGCFPINSSPYGYPSSLMQTVFDTNSQLQDPTFGNCDSKSNGFPSSLLKVSHMLKPSMPKQQNNTPFWNATAGDMNDVRASFFASTQSQFLSPTFEDKPNLNPKATSVRDRDLGSVIKKISCNKEPAFKRPRIETPSPLPTFKVRKEKLGDRVTALQQLVSPFGKTDTASVLHEAIDYIKLLHDQVRVLSTPYMKNGASVQPEKPLDNSKGNEGPRQDLRSRGLCLVPISSTFPVAAETSADFWSPTFGGTFR